VFVSGRNAPALDPLLATHYYDRSAEQQAALGFLADTSERPSVNQNSSNAGSASVAAGEEHSDAAGEQRHCYTPAGTTRLPHGSVGAEAAHRAIAQGNSDDVSAALFKYSAPEEVLVDHVRFYSICMLQLFAFAYRDRLNSFLHIEEEFALICLLSQVMTFPSTCGSCGAPCETRMFVTSILSINIIADFISSNHAWKFMLYVRQSELK
jgi:hypothetical protein